MPSDKVSAMKIMVAEMKREVESRDSVIEKVAKIAESQGKIKLANEIRELKR